MTLPVIKPARADVLKCVARFSELTPVTGGLPDIDLDECKRTFYSVLGFKQPKGAEAFSPFGDAVTPRISHLKAGFGMAYVSAKPGKGVLMHNHDTNETFVVMKGKWKMEWEGERGNDSVVLGALDTISFPIGIQRRFECVEAADGSDEGLMLAVIEGDDPQAEYSPEAKERIESAGVSMAKN